MSIAEKFEVIADAVYDKGRTDEWSDFWDLLQVKGTRVNYDYAFFSYSSYANANWKEDNFRPKYSIKPTSANRMFRNCTHPNLKKAFEDAGLELDFSECKMLAFAFQTTNTKELGVIDASSIGDTGLQGFMCYSYAESVDKIILPSSGTTDLTQLCTHCNNLSHIIFEGVIGQTVTFSYNPLTVESMKSIISCLKNYAGTENEGTKTVTFSETCWEALEASGKPFDDGLTGDETLTWKDYVMSNLGWLI